MWAIMLAQIAPGDASTVALLALAGTSLTVGGTVVAAWLSTHRRRNDSGPSVDPAVTKEVFGLLHDVDQLTDRVLDLERRVDRIRDRMRTEREWWAK